MRAPRAADPAGPGAPVVSGREIAELADRLTAPSSMVAGILALLDDQAAPLRMVATRVGQSPEIAARVLRLANSVLYGQPCSTLDQAVVRVGVQSLRALLLAAQTYPLMSASLAAYHLPRLALVRHSAEAAEAAQSVARQVDGQVAQEAYLAALLHDLGKPILAIAAETRGLAIPAGADVVAWEREVMGVDHARVGAWVCNRWSLPEGVVRAIGLHHHEHPPEAPLALSVWLADAVVHARAGDAGAAERALAGARERGIAPDALEAVVAGMPTERRESRPHDLTERELQVLRLLAAGEAAKQAAQTLGCSPSTVHNHLHHIYRKLNVAGQAQALLLAREEGWV
jgi:putative nucleotidyltransferase with HDIG domain